MTILLSSNIFIKVAYFDKIIISIIYLWIPLNIGIFFIFKYFDLIEISLIYCLFVIEKIL